MNGYTNVVQPHNDMLLCNKEEENPDTSYNLGEPRGHDAECKEPATEDKIPRDSTYMRAPEVKRRGQNGERWLSGVGRGKGVSV